MAILIMTASTPMYITVSQPEHGPNAVKEGENLNPVKTLRMRYDVWRRAQPASFR